MKTEGLKSKKKKRGRKKGGTESNNNATQTNQPSNAARPLTPSDVFAQVQQQVELSNESR